MSAIRPEVWKAVSPYLDQALTLPEQERAAWLASLEQQSPELAGQVKTLLKEHDAMGREGFLEQPLAGLPLQSTLAGQTIGAYTLISLIGEGGMGSVWLAERSDGRFERRAAVKFLNIALAGHGEERFRREGSILGRLTHPHIAQLVDAGVARGGQPFLVLEHVDGMRIDEYCDRHQLDVAARIGLFLDVLSAVAYAHANLIVHRDIKPSNVLVTTDGKVKLLDFGIAKLLDETADTAQLTRDGSGALTPEYAAPEQMTGGVITTPTDVYSLGVVLYQLVTGTHPAGQGPRSPAELIKAIIETEPPRPSDAVIARSAGASEASTCAGNRATTPERLARLLRGDLDTIIAKTLKKNPQERYASAAALADDLQRYLKHEPIKARPDAPAYRAAKFVRRYRTPLAFAVVALVTSVAGLVGALIQARTVRTQRDFALRELSRAEAMNELNSFLLSDAAPGGKPFTVNELLERAEHIVDRQQNKDDVNRADILIAIGQQYISQDEDGRARRVLGEAYQLSRKLPDVSVRAKAACALAVVLSKGGELPRAETLIQEGLRTLPDEPQFALDRVFCLLRAGGVAENKGAAQEAVGRVQSARASLKQAPIPSEFLEVQVLMDLAEAYRNAGQQRDALAAFQQASEGLTSLGRGDTEAAGTLLNNWALALDQLGQPLEAEKIFRRALDISRDNQGDEAVSPMLLINYARTLADLGLLKAAADYAERGYSKARQADDRVVVNQSLLLRGIIYRAQGDVPRARQMLSEVEPRLRHDLPPGHIAFVSLTSEHSLNARAGGDLNTALELANQALAALGASVKFGGQGADRAPILLMRRAEIELQLDRFGDAAGDAGRALSLLQQTVPKDMFSSQLGYAHWILARALQAQGNREDARAEARTAAESFQRALGPDHVDTRAALRLAKLDMPP